MIPDRIGGVEGSHPCLEPLTSSSGQQSLTSPSTLASEGCNSTDLRRLADVVSALLLHSDEGQPVREGVYASARVAQAILVRGQT